MNELKEPLVSIIVITFNSSKYVLETLESAKAQTYQNIELIVSDDCSTDNTVEICRNWIDENKDRFVRTELITVEKNTGIAPNCNRGLYKAKGEWVKFIAGDDLLMEECVLINIDSTLINNKSFYFSKFEVLGDLEVKNQRERYYETRTHLFEGNQLDNLMYYGYYFPTVTFFANTAKLIELNGFNEEYPYHEDFPMWFKILKKGYCFTFIDHKTVIYRIHGDSIYNNMKIVSEKWFDSTWMFYKKEFLSERLKYKQFLKWWDTLISMLYFKISIITSNKKGLFNDFVKLIFIMSPLYVIRKLKDYY